MKLKDEAKGDAARLKAHTGDSDLKKERNLLQQYKSENRTFTGLYR